MKKVLLLLFILLGIVLAQDGEKVRQELERTDRAIRDATPVVEKYANQNGTQLLNQARQVQADAWDMFSQERYRAALAKTLWARELAAKALVVAKFDPKRVAEEIRRTAELMNELEPWIIRCGIPKALELWKAARTEQDAAKRYFEGKQYLLALKFTMAARLHTKAALEVVRGSGNPERVQTEVERTTRLLERAKERVRSSTESGVKELFAKASAWQDEAQAALRQERPLQALKLTFAARDLLLRAWEMGLGALTEELVNEALTETDRLAEQWSPVIKEQGDEQARLTLEQALKQQEQARQSLAGADLKRAWQETSTARRMLARSIEQAQSKKVTPGSSDPEHN